MRRHFILTNGRSGSNYFVQVLNQHPAIVNYGEVLGDWVRAGKYVRPLFRGDNAAFLDWIYRSRFAFAAGQASSFRDRRRRGKATHLRGRQCVATTGIKEFTVNLSRFGLSDYLVERPDIHLVTLVRNDPLARLLSTRRLSATGEIARREGDAGKAAAPVDLDIGQLLHDLEVIEAENEAVRVAAARHKGPVFSLEYEEFFAAGDEEQDRRIGDLLEFLGVEKMTLASEHRRLRTEPFSDSIGNFEAVGKALAGTVFERWLSA